MKLKKRRIIWIVGLVVVCLAVVLIAMKAGGNKNNNKLATVKVEKKTITEKALAIGTIDPEIEITVKSKISGVVKALYIDAGSFVRAGDPMLEIRPDPTPLELAEAKRNVEMESIALDNARREYDRAQQLKDKGLTSDQDFELSQKRKQPSLRLFRLTAAVL